MYVHVFYRYTCIHAYIHICTDEHAHEREKQAKSKHLHAHTHKGMLTLAPHTDTSSTNTSTAAGAASAAAASASVPKIVTLSSPARLSGRFGSAKIARLKVLVVPPAVLFLQPVLRVDTQLYPVPIKVAVTNHVSKGMTNCGVKSCTWITTVIGLPAVVIAGEPVVPAPQAKAVDGEGSVVAGRMVCLVFGSAEEVERATRAMPSSSPMWMTSYSNFLCAQGASSAATCVSVTAAIAAMECAVTDANGLATLSNVKLRSSSALSESLTVWRFVAVNVFHERQISCLNTYSAWVATCSSDLMSVRVINSIQRIEAMAAAGLVVGTISGILAHEIYAYMYIYVMYIYTYIYTHTYGGHH